MLVSSEQKLSELLVSANLTLCAGLEQVLFTPTPPPIIELLQEIVLE